MNKVCFILFLKYKVNLNIYKEILKFFSLSFLYKTKNNSQKV